MNSETAKRYPADWSKFSRFTIISRGSRCENCLSFGEVNNSLTVHHIDYCPENSQPDNLIVLCAKCHLSLQAIDKNSFYSMWPYQTDLFLVSNPKSQEIF